MSSMRWIERYGGPGLVTAPLGRWHPVEAGPGAELGELPVNRDARRRRAAKERGARPLPTLVSAKPVTPSPVDDTIPHELRTPGSFGERRTVDAVVYEWRMG